MVVLEEPDGTRLKWPGDLEIEPGLTPRVVWETPTERRIYHRAHRDGDVWICRFAHAEPKAS